MPSFPLKPIVDGEPPFLGTYTTAEIALANAEIAAGSMAYVMGSSLIRAEDAETLFLQGPVGSRAFTTIGVTGTAVDAAGALMKTAAAAAEGAALLAYTAAEAQGIFDNALPLQNYTALRAYTGRALGVRATTPGIAGVFWRDASDLVSTDNGVTVIVDASGRRWKRIYDGAINVKWAGAVGDGVTDDTLALRAAVSAGRLIDFGRASDTYKVSDSITPQSNSELYFNGALLVQTTANKQIFNLDGLSSIRAIGGRFQGVGTDFINVGGLRSAFRAIAATNIFIDGCRFDGFADSALTITAASNVFFTNNVVVGPAASIAAGDGTCAGVVVGNGCTNIQIRGNNISGTCQGVSSGNGCTSVVVANNNIHDIPGQHGVYMGAGCVALSITGNTIKSTNLQGIKVQNSDSYAFYADSISITGNTIKSTGSHGIIVSNTTASPVYLLRNVAITGNTIDTTTLDDGINLTGCSGVNVSGNVINGPNRDGIRFSDSVQLLIADNIIRSARNNGIREQNACTNVAIKNNAIVDCCIANTVAEEQGIYVLLGTSYTITDNVVRDSGGNMRYGIQNSSTNQATFVVARNVVTGATDYGARFVGTGTNLLFFADNMFSGTSGETLNAPATDQRGNKSRIFYGTAAPTAGAWLVGDVMWSTAPAAGGMVGWVCTTAGTPGTWKAFGGIVPVVPTLTTTATLTAASASTQLANATGGAFTINLPTAASASGLPFNIKKIDSSANAVTIDPSGGELIDGAATLDLTVQWQSAQIQSNGTAWYLL